MRLVKGKATKNIAMAEIFNKEKGDIFFDYKGVPVTKGMLYLEDKFLMIDKMDKIEDLVKGINEYLADELQERQDRFKLFIDGNFTHDEVQILKRIEENKLVELTVSVQTTEDGISIQFV
ncbi:hypothetical protein G7L40_20165 [Paenibacillus polymyxa]|uniref:Uncharacterized protein n=1 Tax=Paenibacillus polymyxa TaxID=1406 RepID=A0A378XZ55_PAEPO|nr:hypothetical protein [Paenibacillus polymyxa]MBE7896195.1 hypothetical protein [Paenibacillus polymyxa]MBG9765864.1 hypothetical protein [Paenibacillus polymyxa]MCC3256725.1 hypothetical protein [Paenibacillus polymyxa]QPK54788.1 hypothetical protein G7035_20205 [Paenibacillus polymyxa]QPK59879.1 hypothetical protein G7L40_20165 [Paenibacillus polymyxa]